MGAGVGRVERRAMGVAALRWRGRTLPTRSRRPEHAPPLSLIRLDLPMQGVSREGALVETVMATYTTVGKLDRALTEASLADGVLTLEGGPTARLLAGPVGAKPTHVFDMANDRFERMPRSATDMPGFAAPLQEDVRPGRRSGTYAVRVLDRTFSYKNLSDLLAGVLRFLAERDDGFLERMEAARNRTRGLVSRTRQGLFDKPHLAARHAEAFLPGWWLNTNNNAEGAKSWLRKAAGVAGLDPGRDLDFDF